MYWPGLGHSAVLPRTSITAIMNYCRKFPMALVRPMGLSCGKRVSDLSSCTWYIIEWGFTPLSLYIPFCYIYIYIYLWWSQQWDVWVMIYMAWIYLNSSISPSCRPWKYNPDVEEFFVEDETTVKLKRSDMTKQIETTEMDDGSLAFFPHT